MTTWPHPNGASSLPQALRPAHYDAIAAVYRKHHLGINRAWLEDDMVTYESLTMLRDAELARLADAPLQEVLPWE